MSREELVETVKKQDRIISALQRRRNYNQNRYGGNTGPRYRYDNRQDNDGDDQRRPRNDYDRRPRNDYDRRDQPERPRGNRDEEYTPERFRERFPNRHAHALNAPQTAQVEEQ